MGAGLLWLREERSVILAIGTLSKALLDGERVSCYFFIGFIFSYFRAMKLNKGDNILEFYLEKH